MNPPYLEQTWRWFGPADPIPLSHIRQAGATGIVTALHHIPCGEIWTHEEIADRKSEVERTGLKWSVVESVPVHEDIKRATGNADRYLDNYCQTLKNLAANGIHIVCYNFMAVTDWTRTNIAWPMPDGSETLRFDILDAAAFDILVLKRTGAEKDYAAEIVTQATQRWSRLNASEQQTITRTILLGLPGTVADLSVEEFREHLAQYKSIDSDRLCANHTAFLKRVIPVAEQFNIKLAIHPDDPPFPIFGLPRIAGTERDLKKIIDALDSPSNGITFCTGSLGAEPRNDLPQMLRRLGDRVHFLHLRNVRREPNGSFFEDDHLAGSTDMAAVMREAISLMHRRNISLPMRPDHGRRMLDDLHKQGFYPGYSAIGRLRGLAELRGLELGIRHALKTEQA